MDQELNKRMLDIESENKDEDEQDEEEIRQKGDWHQQLLKACQKGDYEYVKKCLDKKANPQVEDKKKWTPLIWASCKGQAQIVRLLLQRGGGLQSQNQTEIIQNQSGVVSGQFSNSPKMAQTQSLQGKKVVIGLINNQIKQTALQWACFKGHLQIVQILLKHGYQWDDIDPFGNNCVHLAASGGSLAVFQTLLMFGVSVTQVNSRGHTAKDLATNKEILGLIKQLEFLEKTEPQRKYWCMTTKEFYKYEDYKLEWKYENDKSSELEKPEGRCVASWKHIYQTTDQLNETIQRQDYKLLSDKLIMIEQQKIEIDYKTLENAKIQQEKLRTQNVILAYISSLRHVDNYKTIMKSVNQIKEMLEDAVKRNVNIDKSVVNQANAEIDRLVSERNLRFELDNLEISQSIQEQVQSLQEKMQDAQSRGVESEYLDSADQLKEQMSKNIQFKKILKMFTEYQVREYPDPIKIDPRSKKPIDPVTQKPIEPLQLALNNLKKKKKKDPKFIIPEWATEIKQLEENVKAIETLMKEKEKIDLTPDFLQKANENIARMKKEIQYRKQLDEEAKLIQEAKIAAAKKKK